MDLSGFTDIDRMKIMRLLEEKQVKDTMRMYNSLVERCFMDCITDFTTKTVASKEESCVNKCADKFLRHSARVGQRFQEVQQDMAAQMQTQQQPTQ